MKVYQISPVIFQTTSQFLYFFQTLHQSSVLWKIAPLYFAQKELIKANIFKNFECSSQNLSNSTYQFCNNKSVPLQILHQSLVAWKITPLHFFISNNKYFAQKEPIKGKIFETLGCLGQNLSNSPSQFCNSKSLPLQIPNFASLFSVMKNNSSVFFLAQTCILCSKVAH